MCGFHGKVKGLGFRMQGLAPNMLQARGSQTEIGLVVVMCFAAALRPDSLVCCRARFGQRPLRRHWGIQAVV